MIPSSGTAWSTAWPAASWPTSTGTAGRSSRRRRPGDRARRIGRALLLGLILLPGAACAYFNTFYNARQAFEAGERASLADSAPGERARVEYEKAVEKSAIVLRRYGDSGYADDALLLMGRSLLRLERYSDAASTFERLIDRFPDSDLVPRARLGLARSRRLAGDATAARAALEQIGERRVDERTILHERALIALSAGDEATAVAAFRELHDRFPEYLRDADIAIRVADAQLAVGNVEAALEAYDTYRETAPSPAARRTAGLRLAAALGERGRQDEAAELFAGLLEESPSDSVSAHVRMERGFMEEASGRTDAAMEDFRAVRELLPGSALASRATLHSGRILWFGEKRREEALDAFLDAFLHAPGSAYADSARALARGVSDVIHFRDLVEGSGDRDDRAATAAYRLGEEILAREDDPAAAVEVFRRLVENYPGSPWAPRAMLAVGVLEGRSGNGPESRQWLERLLEQHPESPAADSARLELGLEVPEREPGFYDPSPVLVGLLQSLPRVKDPMIAIADQLDRYAERRAARASVRASAQAEAGAAAAGAQPGAEPQPGAEGEERPTVRIPGREPTEPDQPGAGLEP